MGGDECVGTLMLVYEAHARRGRLTCRHVWDVLGYAFRVRVCVCGWGWGGGGGLEPLLTGGGGHVVGL